MFLKCSDKMASALLAILVYSSVSMGIAGLFSAAAMAQTADSSVVADLVIQVQELQDEVRTLRGRLEEQERETANLKQRQRDQYLDLDQRINQQRGIDQGVPMVASPSSGETAVDPVVEPADSAPVEEGPEVRAPMDTPSETSGLGVPMVESQTVQPTPEMEKAAYDRAFQSLKELEYADAAEEFREFLEQYPNSEWADNAQYWLGESYYVTRNYDIALTAFQELMDRFPNSPKVPDAMLKIGYTHYELKQWDRAQSALTRVTQKYPDTTLARLAESRLRSMRMEGHYQN